MKIVLLGTAYPYRGGLANFNERLAIEFANQGHHIEIFNFSLQYPKLLFPGKSQYSTEKNPLPESIPNLRKVNSINPFNWIKIGLELRKSSPDILIFRYWLPFMAPSYSVIAWITSLNKQTRILSIVDNAIPHEPKFYDIPVTKLFFSICHRFLAMSEKVIKDFSNLTNKPCDFHYHPMYENYGLKISKAEARKKFKLSSEDKVILFFGFIRDYKGLDWLIEAMSDEKIKSNNIKLIIAGEFYVKEEPYFQLAHQLKLENNIIWCTDFIPDQEVAAYFCAADCVVLPYKSATQSGITQIAYYYETPIIATDVGGLKELVPHKKVGLVVSPNIKEISNAINRFFSENLGDLFSKNMIEEKKKFTWNSFVEKIIQIAK